MKRSKLFVLALVAVLSFSTLSVLSSCGQSETTPTPTSTASPSPTTSPTSQPGEFRDLNGHWAQKIILAMVARKFITGYPDGTFQPDRIITRAEFCTILAKALNVSPETKLSSFTDVTGHWAQGSIAAMVRKGYINGYPDESFRPDQPMKRSESAVIVDRVKTLPPAIGQQTFSDVSPDFWAFAPIEAAAKAKIVNGYPDGTFHPEQSATRAEAAVIINGILGLLGIG